MEAANENLSFLKDLRNEHKKNHNFFFSIPPEEPRADAYGATDDDENLQPTPTTSRRTPSKHGGTKKEVTPAAGKAVPTTPAAGKAAHAALPVTPSNSGITIPTPRRSKRLNRHSRNHSSFMQGLRKELIFGMESTRISIGTS